jgi:hypothetical protein
MRVASAQRFAPVDGHQWDDASIALRCHIHIRAKRPWLAFHIKAAQLAKRPLSTLFVKTYVAALVAQPYNLALVIDILGSIARPPYELMTDVWKTLLDFTNAHCDQHPEAQAALVWQLYWECAQKGINFEDSLRRLAPDTTWRQQFTNATAINTMLHQGFKTVEAIRDTLRREAKERQHESMQSLV